ncbi:MAG: glycosyltransferase family 2 protein [Planctomycetota bacterium]|jgi:glycosyltransferase involved in cell wall biosynthesis
MVKFEKDISVIFPAYNEEQNIATCITAAHRILSELVKDFEIIIVDDGSIDSTGEVAKDLVARFNKVRVITKKSNEGYGKALRDGFREAKHELVFFTDADGQFDIFYLKDLMQYIDAYDIVVGSRLGRQDTFQRKVFSFFYNRLVRCFFGLSVRDINCAFKLFRRDILKRIEIRSKYYIVNAEILAKARSLGARIKEVNVPHLPRLGGNSKVSSFDIPMTLKEIVSLYKELHTK